MNYHLVFKARSNWLNFVSVSSVMTCLSAFALGLIMCLHVPTLPKFWLFNCGVPWFFLQVVFGTREV